MDALTKAIKIVGGPAKMAAELHVTTQAVCFWRDGKRTLPADHCPSIERMTAGEVRCEELCPDVDWGYLRNTAKREAA